MDSIREGVKKPWAKVVIFAIVISFVGAGYFTSTFFLGDPNAVAVVNDESISIRDFQVAYNRKKQEFGDVYKQIIKTEEQERDFRENVLQTLISQVVVIQSAEQLGMRVSTSAIRKRIQEMPVFQVDGVYSLEQLEFVLRNNQRSKPKLRKDIANNLVLGQFFSGISESDFVLPSESQNSYKITGQKRTGKALSLKYALFDETVDVTDEETSEYYTQNKESFRIEEKVTVDYVELSMNLLQKNIQINDEQVTEFYNNNLDRFKSSGERRYSHILISLDDDESSALDKANKVKQRLDAGEDFITLVKSESNDEFSIEGDGDLGVIGEGDMEQPFENSAKALEKIGDISAPVRTSFGYHIIKLTELVASETQAIDEVKTQIIDELKKQSAEEMFYEKMPILEEKAYETGDSIAEVAKLIGVEVKTSPMFGRAGSFGIFANAQVKEAAFSENVLEAKLNSEMININDDHVVVLRLNKYKASEIQPLEAVKDKVIVNLKKSKAKTAAVKFGESVKEKLAKSESVDELLALKKLSWKELSKVERTSAALPYLQLQSFFRMQAPVAGKTKLETMQEANEYVLLVLESIEDGNLEKAEKTVITQTEQRLSRFYGGAGYRSIIDEERSKASVVRNENNLER